MPISLFVTHFDPEPRDQNVHQTGGGGLPVRRDVCWGEPEVRIRHILTCNNMEALRGAVLRGLGIGCMPDFLAAASLKTGELVPLLLDHLDLPGQFNLILPSSLHLSPKIRVFVDFIWYREERRLAG